MADLVTLTEDAIRERVGLKHQHLGDVRSLSLPGMFQDKITYLGKSLKHFSRLKCLDLSRNTIVSLEGLQHLTVLEKLNLYSNNIASLTEMFHLRKLIALKELDLRLNPVTKNESDYRLFLVHMLPNLRFLDDKPVRDRERKAALECFTTERAFELQDPSPASGVSTKPGHPRAAYIRSLSQKYSVLDDDDEAVLDLIAKSELELNTLHRITGSAKKDQEAKLHSLQGIRLIDDGVIYRKYREDRSNSQQIKKQKENISKQICSEDETPLQIQKDEQAQQILPKPSHQPTQNYNMNHLLAKNTNGIRVKCIASKLRQKQHQDPNLKFEDEVQAHNKIISHFDFTPHPSTEPEETAHKKEAYKILPVSSAEFPHNIPRNRNHSIKKHIQGFQEYNGHPSYGNDCKRVTTNQLDPSSLQKIEDKEDCLSEAGKDCKKAPCVLDRASEYDDHDKYEPTSMEYLLDLIDKYWNGAKSLHSNEAFLCKAKQIISKVQHINCPHDLQKKSTIPNDQNKGIAPEKTSLHEPVYQSNDRLQSLEMQLQNTRKDMDCLKQQLDLVLQENGELKNMLLNNNKKEKNTLHFTDPNLKDLRISDLQSHNQQLQQEIDVLKCKLQYFDKIQSLTEMLQESHRSLISSNEHLMKELKGTQTRHMTEDATPEL
ncbi:centrosomal protein of 72 kDa [Bombina bombina]|uniref:centrosomal protein of 72 kDa n=1 Tax=Bombina bombina TaxID=8345 RepID=UPI00235AFAAC|nr:centrosomal protein of 72 kDa [Bombina bombina]